MASSRTLQKLIDAENRRQNAALAKAVRVLRGNHLIPFCDRHKLDFINAAHWFEFQQLGRGARAVNTAAFEGQDDMERLLSTVWPGAGEIWHHMPDYYFSPQKKTRHP